MKEVFKHRIGFGPFNKIGRLDKAVIVDRNNGNIADITDEKGNNLDGNVKSSYNYTLTSGGSTVIDKNAYGTNYTSVKKVTVTAPIESAKTVSQTLVSAGNTTINVPVGDPYIGQDDVAVVVTAPVEAAKTASVTVHGNDTYTASVTDGNIGQGNVTVNITVQPVTLTQSEYDALVSAGTVDSSVIYLISA